MDLAVSMWRPHKRLVVIVLPVLFACLAGCSPRLASPQELAAFHAAGPVTPTVDVGKIIKAKATTGPYRVTSGDVLEVSVRAVTLGGPAAAKGTRPSPSPGTYRVEVRDILQLQMPAVLKAVGEVYTEEIVPYACRVGKNGSIWLPTAGEMPVAGKSLLEIEEAIVAAYFPKFVRKRPSVLARVVEHASVVEAKSGLFAQDAFVCRVNQAGAIRLPIGDVKVAGGTVADAERAVEGAYCPKHVATPPAVFVKITEHLTSGVTVVGGVKEPGKYNLRSDEMSLVGLLMKAGGIVPGGAGVVRIRHADSFDPKDAETLALPVRDASIPFADIALKEGDVVEVERLDTQVFTILGLVQSPGTFPYPTDARYNLAQALAFAGGGDPVGDPRYISLYRQDASGNLVTARFRQDGNHLTQAASLRI
ncbi:MAG: polysaccharide biosynthesis/export family protein, partial [Candidatus Brocadiae bacterium]|nr:polysaccharide biosynthesis/export family protein [Candidatus Brocadiia bacterium]